MIISNLIPVSIALSRLREGEPFIVTHIGPGAAVADPASATLYTDMRQLTLPRCSAFNCTL